MNKLSLFVIAIALSGCASKPIESYYSSTDRVSPIQFPSDQKWQEQATFKIRVNYDEIHDSKDQKKTALQIGASRGIQFILSLVSFYAIPKPIGRVNTGQSYEDICVDNALSTIVEEWQSKDVFKLGKICSLSSLENVPAFARTDAILSDPRFSLVIGKESSLYKITGDGYYRSFSDKLVTATRNDAEPTFTVQNSQEMLRLIDSEGANGFKSRGASKLLKISFHPNDQDYLLRHLWVYKDRDDLVSASVLQSISAVQVSGNSWSPIIPNLDLMTFLNGHLPKISKEQYQALSQALTEKLDDFELGDLVHQCNGQSASDICISQYPKFWDETIISEPRVAAWLKEYNQLIKGIDKKGPNSQKTLEAFNKIKGKIEEIKPLLAETWGFVLLNNTNMTATRNGDSVVIEFKIDFKKAFNQFSLEAN